MSQRLGLCLRAWTVRPSGRCSRAVRIRIRRIIKFSVIFLGRRGLRYTPFFFSLFFDRLWSLTRAALDGARAARDPCGVQVDTRGSLFFFRRLITNWGAPPRCFLRFFLSDQARSRCFWMHSQSPRDGWRRDYAQDVFFWTWDRSLDSLDWDVLTENP